MTGRRTKMVQALRPLLPENQDILGPTQISIIEFLRDHGPCSDSSGRATAILASGLKKSGPGMNQSIQSLDRWGIVVRRINGKRTFDIRLSDEAMKLVPLGTMRKKDPTPMEPDHAQVGVMDCEHCNFSTATKAKLLVHIAEQHPDKYNEASTPISTQEYTTDMKFTDTPSLELFQQGATLYEALMENATPTPDGMVTKISIPNLAPILRRRTRVFSTDYAVRVAFTWLRHIGSVQVPVNAIKLLVVHPAELFPEVAAEVPTQRPKVDVEVAPIRAESNGKGDKPSMADVIGAVPTDQLATAIATGMWNRYEWALSEINRLNVLLTTREAEIKRLTTINETLGKPDVAQVAHLLLATDAP